MLTNASSVAVIIWLAYDLRQKLYWKKKRQMASSTDCRIRKQSCYKFITEFVFVSLTKDKGNSTSKVLKFDDNLQEAFQVHYGEIFIS